VYSKRKNFYRNLRSVENNGILNGVRFLLSRVNGDAHVRDREATTGAEERVRLVVNLLEAALKFVRASGASRFAAKGQVGSPPSSSDSNIARASFDL
jgi:hypothetical protein